MKLLAALNVITTEGDTNRYKQDVNANTLQFDYMYNKYTTSQIKEHVDSYKTAVESRMGAGKTIQEAKLMSKEEVETLGGNIVNKTTSGCTEKTGFVNETSYWLNSPKERRRV